MYIARKKKKENIAEYILYMWQIEDIIRGFNFDIERIKTELIPQYHETEERSNDICQWYSELIDMMTIEGVKEKGHIQIVQNALIDLTDIHLRLLSDTDQIVYNSLFYKTLPYILELKNKNSEGNEIEISLNALYGLMMLRIQKKEISEGTKKALDQISTFISTLSKLYQQEKLGIIELD